MSEYTPTPNESQYVRIYSPEMDIDTICQRERREGVGVYTDR